MKWLPLILLFPAALLAGPRHPFPKTPDEVWQNDRDLDDQATKNPMTRDLNANGFRITNLAEVAASSDAVKASLLGFFNNFSIGTLATSTTTTSTTFIDTGLDTEITIATSTHRVLAVVAQNCGGVLTAGSNTIEIDLQILRNGSVVHGPVSKVNFGNLNANSFMDVDNLLFEIDSPGVGTHTYKTQFARGNSSNAIAHTCQGAGGTSYIFLAELGAE